MLRERCELARDDRKAVEGEFEEGSLVWLRFPGFDTNLEETWDGPYEIVERKN